MSTCQCQILAQAISDEFFYGLDSPFGAMTVTTESFELKSGEFVSRRTANICLKIVRSLGPEEDLRANPMFVNGIAEPRGTQMVRVSRIIVQFIIAAIVFGLVCGISCRFKLAVFLLNCYILPSQARTPAIKVCWKYLVTREEVVIRERKNKSESAMGTWARLGVLF